MSSGLVWLNTSEAAENLEKTTKETISWVETVFLPGLKTMGIRLLISAVVLFLGGRMVKWLKRHLSKSFQRSNLDEGVAKFLLSFVGIVLDVLLVLLVITIMGVDTSSLAAVVASAGLTLGLALQGSLSNFAGGVLILVMKPFRIGDYIIAEGTEGTVTSIDIFYTRLSTIDNRKVVIPNGGLSNTNIINVTNEVDRRLDLLIPVSYGNNLKEVKRILQRVVDGSDLILPDQDIDIFVSDFADSAITMGIHVWTLKDNYWPLKWQMLERIKEAFDEEGIEIPFNQLDVHVKTEMEKSFD